ncbi:RNA-binding protein [Erysipelotrichaceae bacterium MTC7]|nr:RNA-binding protein [Erysipelotrichaceae bacterium MTC7]
MLNGKQRRALRALAVNTKALVQIGKGGLSANLVESTEVSLEAHELVKITVLKNCDDNVKEMALDLASMTNSELVQVVGRVIVLYRPSKKKLIQI